MTIGIIFNNKITIVADRYHHSSGIFTYNGEISSSDKDWKQYHDFITSKQSVTSIIIIDGKNKRVIGHNGKIGKHDFNYDKKGNMKFSGRIDF